MGNIVQMSLNMSSELAEKLEQMSEESHVSEGEVLRKAIYLMSIAMDNKKQGNAIAILNRQGQKVSEIYGV